MAKEVKRGKYHHVQHVHRRVNQTLFQLLPCGLETCGLSLEKLEGPHLVRVFLQALTGSLLPIPLQEALGLVLKIFHLPGVQDKKPVVHPPVAR